MKKSRESEYATVHDLNALEKRILKVVAKKEDLKNLATKDELKNLATKDEIKNLATKDELKNLATKDEIKNLATKDELKNLATKDEIKNLATKDELHQMGNILGGQIIKLEDSIKLQDNKIQKILHIVEGIAGEFDLYKTEKISTDHAIDRHEGQLHNHEERITKIEENVI